MASLLSPPNARSALIALVLAATAFTSRNVDAGQLFGNPTAYETGTNPRCIQIADLNHDGKPDIVVVNDSTPAYCVLLGNGDGTFQPRAFAQIPYRPPYGTLVDLDHDGNLDLVIAGGIPSGEASVLMGHGDGTFGPRLGFSDGVNPLFVDVADLNGDGKLDLLFSDNLFAFQGNGDGTFGTFYRAFEGTAHQALLADFDEDGFLDLAEVESDRVVVHPGNGSGIFTSNAPSIPVGQWIEWAAIGDVNGDGHMDIALADEGAGWGAPGNAFVLLGLGNGVFAPPVECGPLTPRSRSILVADVDEDGRPDLVVTHGRATGELTSPISILLGRGDGTFRQPTTIALDSPVYTAVGDLNLDGHPDLVVAEHEAHSVSVLLNTGLGPASVDGGKDLRPRLLPALPNPSRDATLLRFVLAQASRVAVDIHDVSGRRVRSLGSRTIGAGEQELEWDGRDDAGRSVGNGIYLVRIQAGPRQMIGKVVRIR